MVSVFKGTAAHPVSKTTIDKIYLAIKNGGLNNTTVRDTVEKIRATEDKAERDTLKRTLISVTFAGTCEHRKIELMQSPSGYTCLDFDHVGDKYDYMWGKFIKDEYTLLAFRSPSGDGMKVIVKIPASWDTYRSSCNALKDYYGSEFLNHLTDPSRLCFLSYDPDAFFNENSKVFTKMRGKEKLDEVVVTEDDKNLYTYATLWLTKYNQDKYEDGNKHHFLVRLTAACLRLGVNPTYLKEELIKTYQNMASAVDSKAFENIVDSIYKNWSASFGTFKVLGMDIVDSATGEKLSKDGASEEHPDAGIIRLNDNRQSMLDEYENGHSKGESTYFSTIDPHWTWKRGELTLMGGIPNHGKTTMMLQLALIKSINEGTKWGVFSPEQNPPNDFFNDLIGMYIGKPVHKHVSNRMSAREYELGMDFVNEHFFFVYPEKKKHTPRLINEKFERLIVKFGCAGCITDPFNQLDHDWASSNNRDDRYISLYLSDEKRFAIEHDCYKIIIAHPNSSRVANADGDYACPKVFDIAGGALWAAKCDNILQVHRPKFNSDNTDQTTEFHSQKIKKQRIVGKPGVASLQYDWYSGRYYENGRTPFDSKVVLKQERLDILPKVYETDYDDAPF